MVGVMTITAGKGLRRSFTWEGASRSVVVVYTRDERWYGSLGLYYPGPGSHWFSHNGITRGVINEGQQHFATIDEAAAWLRKRSEYFPLVFSNDGSCRWLDEDAARQQLTVDVLTVMRSWPKADEPHWGHGPIASRSLDHRRAHSLGRLALLADVGRVEAPLPKIARSIATVDYGLSTLDPRLS